MDDCNCEVATETPRPDIGVCLADNTPTNNKAVVAYIGYGNNGERNNHWACREEIVLLLFAPLIKVG